MVFSIHKVEGTWHRESIGGISREGDIEIDVGLSKDGDVTHGDFVVVDGKIIGCNRQRTRHRWRGQIAEIVDGNPQVSGFARLKDSVAIVVVHNACAFIDQNVSHNCEGKSKVSF